MSSDVGPKTGCLPSSGRDRGAVSLGMSLWSNSEHCDPMDRSPVTELCWQTGMQPSVARRFRHKSRPPFPRLPPRRHPHLRTPSMVVVHEPPISKTRASRVVNRAQFSDRQCTAPDIACTQSRPEIRKLSPVLYFAGGSANHLG